MKRRGGEPRKSQHPAPLRSSALSLPLYSLKLSKPAHTMTFFVKFFIVSAALAVAVNGSTAGFAEGGLEAVRSHHGSLDVDGGEI